MGTEHAASKLKTKHRPLRRIVVTAVVFLLLGAVVNVAVAWGCSLAFPKTRIPSLDRHLGELSPGMPVGAEVSDRQQSFMNRAGIASWKLEGQDFRSTLLLNRVDRLGATKATLADVYVLQEGIMGDWDEELFVGPPIHEWFSIRYKGTLTQSGWPLCSLAKIEAFRVNRVYDSKSRVWMPNTSLTMTVLPNWPGFIVNTFLYGALLFIACVSLFFTRRMIRKRKGRCMKCGYDLRGCESETCPECGHVVIPAKAGIQWVDAL